MSSRSSVHRLVSAAAGHPLALGAAVAAGGFAVFWATDRAPYPYSQRLLLNVPLPFLGSSRLLGLLEPRPGETVLVVGPGTGLQSVAAARALGSSGTLHVIDVQPEMAAHVVGRARRKQLPNVVASCGDATRLPFADAVFDAAYLVTVLGETGDPTATLSELRRVVAPHGRIVVGEFVGDPHGLGPARLARHATAAGLVIVTRRGVRLSYIARLRRPGLERSPRPEADGADPAAVASGRTSPRPRP